MQVKPVSFTEKHRQSLAKQKYTPEEIEVVALAQGLYDAKHSAEAGQVICNYVGSKCNLKLTFSQWDGDNVYCINPAEIRHVIIGSWCEHRFILRGVVKPRSKRLRFRFRWLINGQASTNSMQVTYFAERDEVGFPEFKKIADQYQVAIGNAAARQRAS